MNTTLVEKVVNAVLYEGYILYPYRASSKKNRERFTFGRVYPEDYSIAQHGAEPDTDPSADADAPDQGGIRRQKHAVARKKLRALPVEGVPHAEVAPGAVVGLDVHRVVAVAVPARAVRGPDRTDDTQIS